MREWFWSYHEKLSFDGVPSQIKRAICKPEWVPWRIWEGSDQDFWPKLDPQLAALGIRLYRILISYYKELMWTDSRPIPTIWPACPHTWGVLNSGTAFFLLFLYTGMVQLSWAGLPLMSCGIIGAPSVQGVIPTSIFRCWGRDSNRLCGNLNKWSQRLNNVSHSDPLLILSRLCLEPTAQASMGPLVQSS